MPEPKEPILPPPLPPLEKDYSLYWLIGMLIILPIGEILYILYDTGILK